MLRVIEKYTPSEFSLELDVNIPLAFRCYEVYEAPTLWWTVGNFKTSLIEIGISKSTGAIFNVTVVSLEKIEKSFSSENLVGNIDVFEGLPVCEVDVKYKVNDEIEYIKEEKELISYQGEDFIIIYFGEFSKTSKFYTVGRLAFGVNDLSEICLLKLDRLTKFEMEILLNR